jgi:hypothetical protein
VYVNVSVSRLPIPDCPICNVFFLCMPMSVSLDCTKEKDVRDRTIRNSKSRDTDIDIHKKKRLEIGQSGMDNLETMTLTCVYVNVSVSRLSIPDCSISNVFFLCMSMSMSLDCPFLIVPSLTSCSCVCQCQFL